MRRNRTDVRSVTLSPSRYMMTAVLFVFLLGGAAATMNVNDYQKPIEHCDAKLTALYTSLESETEDGDERENLDWDFQEKHGCYVEL